MTINLDLFALFLLFNLWCFLYSFKWFEFNDAMEVTSFVLAFGESRWGLFLNSHFTFSNVEKLWEFAFNISDNILPLLDMETRITFWDFTNYYPRIKFTDLLCKCIGIDGLNWSSFKSNWTHVMVIAMINICSIIWLKTCHKLIQSFFFISSMSNIISMHFVHHLCFASHSEFAIQ